MFLIDTEKLEITYQDETKYFIPLAKLFILEHTHLENVLLAPVYRGAPKELEYLTSCYGCQSEASDLVFTGAENPSSTWTVGAAVDHHDL